MPLPGTSFDIDSEFLSIQDSCLRETVKTKEAKDTERNNFLIFSVMSFAFSPKVFFLTQLNYFTLSCFLTEFKQLEIGKI